MRRVRGEGGPNRAACENWNCAESKWESDGKDSAVGEGLGVGIRKVHVY